MFHRHCEGRPPPFTTPSRLETSGPDPHSRPNFPSGPDPSPGQTAPLAGRWTHPRTSNLIAWSVPAALQGQSFLNPLEILLLSEMVLWWAIISIVYICVSSKTFRHFPRCPKLQFRSGNPWDKNVFSKASKLGTNRSSFLFLISVKLLIWSFWWNFGLRSTL